MEHKIIAIAFSDFHLHEWKQFNENNRRLQVSIDIAKTLIKRAAKLKVPLLFTGDLLEDDNCMTNNVFKALAIIVNELRKHKVVMYAISGNHDQCSKNTLDNPSNSWVETLSYLSNGYFVCLDNRVEETGRSGVSISLYGVPYMSGNKDFKKAIKRHKDKLNPHSFNILMIHTALHGAKEPDGSTRTEVENIPLAMYKLFEGFDLVLSGHIHKPQKLGSNIYMLGATNHQRRSDRGCKMGYWAIYKDSPPLFIKSKAPEFIEVEEMPLEGDDFYVLKPKKSNAVVDERHIVNEQSRSKLAKTYCKIKGIKSKTKVKKLANLLNKAE